MNCPAASLLNRVASAKRILGRDISSLEEAWNSSPCKEDKMIKAVNEFFRARFPKPDQTVELADQIVRRILEDREIKTVDDLANQTHIGKRSLQRIFNEYVGVNPKWVIRRYRLHELVERFNSGGEPNWSELALELGYFDQAHLINDFRTLVGYSPTKYKRLLKDS